MTSSAPLGHNIICPVFLGRRSRWSLALGWFPRPLRGEDNKHRNFKTRASGECGQPLLLAVRKLARPGFFARFTCCRRIFSNSPIVHRTSGMERSLARSLGE